MRSGRASITAQVAAWSRVVETQRPAGERVCSDPVARELLGPFLRAGAGVCRAAPLGRAILGGIDRLLPGAHGLILGRTRFIDDALVAGLKVGATQLVVLGAGLDTRAYRIAELARVRVFEVDHPNTQSLKRRGVTRALDGKIDHVIFVPIDFGSQDLDAAMTASGFERDRRTFWIWEGVTQYISEDAVDATFRFIASASAPDSRVAFTYLDRTIVEGRRSGWDAMAFFTRLVGDPFVSALEASELRGYLAARGFELLEDVAGAEFERRYFAPLGRRDRVLEHEHTVLARCVGSPA